MSKIVVPEGALVFAVEVPDGEGGWTRTGTPEGQTWWKVAVHPVDEVAELLGVTQWRVCWAGSDKRKPIARSLPQKAPEPAPVAPAKEPAKERKQSPPPPVRTILPEQTPIPHNGDADSPLAMFVYIHHITQSDRREQLRTMQAIMERSIEAEHRRAQVMLGMLGQHFDNLGRHHDRLRLEERERADELAERDQGTWSDEAQQLRDQIELLDAERTGELVEGPNGVEHVRDLLIALGQSPFGPPIGRAVAKFLGVELPDSPPAPPLPSDDL